MPQIIYSEQANRDIVRFVEFMQEIEPSLKQRVISTIFDGIEILQKFPKIAKPSQDENISTCESCLLLLVGLDMLFYTSITRKITSF
jgi:plasmid stabilization system protein ParE